MVAVTLAEYVPAGEAVPAVKESVPLNPPVAGANCAVTPLGKLLAPTVTELPVGIPPRLTPTVPGVPSCAATTVPVDRDSVSVPGGPGFEAPVPPHAPINNDATASPVAKMPPCRKRRCVMRHQPGLLRHLPFLVLGQGVTS